MKTFTVQGAARALRGELDVPGDKSIGHRAVLFAGLAQGRSLLRGLSGGQDNGRTAAALRALGIEIAAAGPGAVAVLGRGLRGLRPASGPIECGNSGTTLRLLCGVLAAQPFASSLRGDAYLHARPMRRVVEPLAAMGAQVRGAAGARPGEIYPPLEIIDRGPAASLRGVRWQSAIASAQVKSAILLCGLLADGDTEVVEPARSRDHTERMLRHQGAPLTVADEEGGGASSRLETAGWGRALLPLSIDVPGDLSSAAFLLGAALLVPGSRALVRGVGVNPTRTGVLDVFGQMAPGCVQVVAPREQGGEPVADLEGAGAAGLRPVAIRGALSVRALDELPLIAALCGAAEGESVIEGAAELRVKESDRIAASCALLRAFGVECEERPDGLRVLGRGPGGLAQGPVEVESFGDHRIAMAAAVLALARQGQGGGGPSTLIRDVDNVATSYPGFAAALRALGAEIIERG